jgi:hypothetical protein
MVAILATEFHRDISVFDSNGLVVSRWRLPQRIVPSALSVSHDTVAVQAGQYDGTRIYFFRRFAASPVGVIEYSVHRGSSVSLVGSNGGAFVLHTETGSAPAGAELRALQAVTHDFRPVDRRGSDAPTTFTWIDSAPRAVVRHYNNSMNMTWLGIPAPWAPRPTFAAGGDRIFIASGSATIDAFDLAGRHVDRIKVEPSIGTVTPPIKDSLFVAWRAGPGKPFPASSANVVRALPVMDELPVIAAMCASPEGILAITRRTRLDKLVQPVSVQIVDPATKQGSLVALPSGAIVQAFTGTNVIATVPVIGTQGLAETFGRDIVTYRLVNQ